MREILFRGKRIDSGEWVYGTPFQEYSNFWGEWEWIIQTKHPLTNVPYLHLQIDRKTVGQFTGLTDKNGKKIFEGDMIKPFDDEIDKMVVEFHQGQFLLCLYGNRGYMAEYGWEECGNYGCFEAEPLSSYGDDIEVIGNIHDNPELMGGAEDGN